MTELSRDEAKPPRGDFWEPLVFILLGRFMFRVYKLLGLRRWVNRRFISDAINTIEPRPYRLSTMANHTSWNSLTDRTYNTRELDPAPVSLRKRPKAEALLELFIRDRQHDSPKSTVLFAYVAQWFTDGFLRSDRSVIDPKTGKIKEPRDITRNESTHEVDLSQLYGLTPADTAVLRHPHNRALLDYQLIGGEAYPRCMFDAKGERLSQYKDLRMVGTDKGDEVDRRELLAMGSDAANTQIGYAMVTTLFLREHNRIAREIRKAQIKAGDPWSPARVFDAARATLTVLTIKLVIEQYINHITPWGFAFSFDPEGFEKQRWHRQNWMAVEFNLLYRWHCLIPTELVIGCERRTLWDTMFKTRSLFSEHGLGALIDDASRQHAGAIELFNTSADPLLLMRAELPTIKAAREVRLRSYNEYRVHCGFSPAASIEDISSDRRVVDALRRLYGDDVNAVEFYPGLYAEDRVKGSVVPPMMGRLVAAHAFSQLLTNPLLAPAVYRSVDTFSARGREIIDTTTTLKQLVKRNVRSGGDAVALTHSDWSP